MVIIMRLIIAIMMLVPNIAFADMGVRDAIKSIDANVIFMRHALAPGTGDPYDFNINDCDTQRNLNDIGRKQARDIGKYLKQHNIKFTEILSSQWCRCVDTVTEMDIAALSEQPWRVFFGLNSFYDGHIDEDAVLDELHKKLAQIPNDALVLMVTHQVVMTAITDIFPASGDMIAYNSKRKTAQKIIID